LALVVSLVGHALLAIVVVIFVVTRRGPPTVQPEDGSAAEAATVIDVEDEDTAAAQLAEMGEPGREDRVQGAAEAPAPAAIPTPQPADATPIIPAPKTTGPEAPSPPPTSSARAIPSGLATLPTPTGTSRAADPTGTAPPEHGGDGGGQGKRAPDVAGRFAKELPAVAIGVDGWHRAPTGDAGVVTVILTLGAEGKIDRNADLIEKPERAPPLLVESVRRAAHSLYMVLALPERPVGAGRVRLEVRATVSDVPPLHDGAEPKFDAGGYAKGRGSPFFVSSSGRKVVFEVKVLDVAPAAD
jgi:hypothetical protein